jgi:hypothetical protein
MYFNTLPKIRYKNIIDKNNVTLVTDILRRVKIRTPALQNLVLFDIYDVPSGETPEMTAFKHFGSTEYHWIILMTNDITNIYTQWPLSENAFSDYLMDKYGDDVDAVHHYEINQTSGDTTKVLQVASSQSGATTVTNREYEERLQDERRKIRLLDRSYLKTFVEEFEKLINA